MKRTPTLSEKLYQKGMSYAQLARLIELDPKWVQKIVTNPWQMNLKLEYLLKILEIIGWFDIPKHWLKCPHCKRKYELEMYK